MVGQLANEALTGGDVDRSEVITVSGGKYRQLSDEEKKADPNIIGIYTFTHPGGFNCGNTIFVLQRNITLLKDNNVVHNKGWFGIGSDGISVPVMGNHTHDRGVLDNLHTEQDGKATLKYVLNEKGTKVGYPPVEIGKPVFIIEGKRSSGLMKSTLVESIQSVNQKLQDNVTEWTGTRLNIFNKGRSVLNRGKFRTSAEGATFSNATDVQTYLGATELLPKFNNSDGREIRNDFVYKFIPETINK